MSDCHTVVAEDKIEEGSRGLIEGRRRLGRTMKAMVAKMAAITANVVILRAKRYCVIHCL